MHAVTFEQYGQPKEVMEFVSDIETPKPGAQEVLVNVECSSINAADKHMVQATYLIIRLVLGLRKPRKKNRILGMDVAGTISAVGEEVRGFHVGDQVVADIRKSFGGGFAQYATINQAALVKKPADVSFQQAATVPISGQAAMMGSIHCAINDGDRILITGGSGGVGSFGVQMAKAQGAHVTATCSAAKAEAVRGWGADEVLDYKTISVASLAENSFDAVFDAASFGNPGQYARILKDDGRYVLVGGSYYNMLRVKLFGRRYGKGLTPSLRAASSAKLWSTISNK